MNSRARWSITFTSVAVCALRESGVFLHTEHLPQLLSPDDYRSPAQFRRELDALFLPSWHFATTSIELPRDGDSARLELLGRPVRVRNCAGTFRAWIDVPERWFGPDEQRECRTETCGSLIFVCFDNSAPGLRSFLGEHFDQCAAWCSDRRLLVGGLDVVIDANWKLKMENSLENYHLEEVHRATFGRMPPPDCCQHAMGNGWSFYSAAQEPQDELGRRLDRLVRRLLKSDENDNVYRLYQRYPHFMCGSTRLFSWVELLEPLSPDRTRVVTRLFSHRSRSGKLTSRLLCRLAAAFGRWFFRKVAFEDLAIVCEVQKGLRSRTLPSRGLISVREERIFHFQQYIRETTGEPGGAQPALSA